MIFDAPIFRPGIFRTPINSRLIRPSNLPPPVISGLAYPLLTLTASRAGQWAIDGVPVIGQTAATFQVPLLAYGRTITCDNSAPVVVWKPWDIAGVVSVRVMDRRMFNAVSPDVVAADGQTVRRANDQVSNQPADQTNSAFQPIWRATGQSGNPSLEFDGVDDFLILSGGELSTFTNRSHGYIIVGCRDTNPTGGQAEHTVVSFRGGTGGNRMVVNTRAASGNGFSVFARRLDAVAGVGTSLVASDSNYHVHTAEALWGSGVLNHRLDGAQAGTVNFPSAGNSDVTASGNALIAANSVTGTSFFPGHITCVILANQILSATDRSRLERFAGLFGGLNIPLV